MSDEPKVYPENLVRWLLSDETGASSIAIVSHLTGLPSGWRKSIPYDAGDLNLCRRLLDAVPAFAERFGEMRTYSPQWAEIVNNWGMLCKWADVKRDHWLVEQWMNDMRRHVAESDE